VGLTGGGGVGKSALAYHFATVHQDKFPDGVIGLRVDKKDVNTIARRLAIMIGHPIHEDDDIEAREIMQRFFAPRRMLLIFDNAEEARIKVLRPGGNRCAIIVTTRKQNLPVSLDLSETATIRLRSLPENDALDLLRNILGQSEIDNALAAAKRIAEVVGRLPLALQVAGGTLRGKRRSLATYADSLQRQKEQLRLLPRLRLGEDPDLNVVACLNLSLECLQEEEIDFFACLGVCGEDGFALRTAMAAGGCEDEFDAEDFLDKLYEVSLLNSEEVQQDRFVLHPLVREYARSVAQDRNLLSLAQERHAQFFVERLQFDDLEDETVIAEVATDLSDVFLAAEWLQNYWGQTTEKKRKKGYRFVLKLQPLFEHYGYWEQGISLMERLQTWAEQFDDWSTVFQCQIHQGRYWSFVEEFERAEEILISAKDISSDDQKIEDIDTRRKRHAKVLGVLGGVYQKQGKTEKAIETFEAQIEIDESLDDKKSLAIVWNRLGGLLEKQGQFKEAQHAFETEIELAKSLDDKRELAIGWNCLGGVLEKQGQFKEAQHAFETEIELVKSLDDKHGLAIGWNCLGGLLEKQGQLKEAQQAFETEIAIADDKRQITIGWSCLVRVLEKQGKLKEGKKAFESLLLLYKKDVEAIKPEIGNKRSLTIVYNRLGNLLQSQNNLEEAQEIFKQGIALAESLDDKLQLAIGWSCLGGVLKKQGKFKEAQHAFEKEIVLRKPFKEQLKITMAWNRLGGVLQKQGELKEAQHAFETAIAIAERIKNKLQLAISWSCLGGVLEEQGKIKEAQQAFEKRIAITESINDKRQLAIGWNCLGGLLEKQEKFKEAQQAFEKAIAIAESIKNKLQLAISWNCLGELLEKQEKFKEAQQAFEKAIAIAENIDEKLQLAIGWNCLGKVLEKQGKLEEAQQAFEKAIANAENIDNKLQLAIGWNCLGELLEKQGKLEEAEKAFEKGIANTESIDDKL